MRYLKVLLAAGATWLMVSALAAPQAAALRPVVGDPTATTTTTAAPDTGPQTWYVSCDEASWRLLFDQWPVEVGDTVVFCGDEWPVVGEMEMPEIPEAPEEPEGPEDPEAPEEPEAPEPEEPEEGDDPDNP